MGAELGTALLLPLLPGSWHELGEALGSNR